MTTIHQQTWKLEKTYGSQIDILMILANFGGLIYFGYIVLSYLLRPISEYSFNLKAAR